MPLRRLSCWPSEAPLHWPLRPVEVSSVAGPFPRTQGQSLVWIHDCAKTHRRPSAENEIAGFFDGHRPSARGKILPLVEGATSIERLVNPGP